MSLFIRRFALLLIVPALLAGVLVGVILDLLEGVIAIIFRTLKDSTIEIKRAYREQWLECWNGRGINE